MHKQKHLGQHFLVNPTILSEIVGHIAPQQDQHLLEIGAGDGALTSRLVEHQARLTALEIDSRRIAQLNANYGSDSVEIKQQDAMRYNPAELGPQIRLVGNLPYNISSQILLRYAAMPCITDMHCLIQRELADRLLATPGSGDFGRFTLMFALWRGAETCLEVPPDAFDPPPKVWSTFIRIGAYKPAIANEQIRKCFGQLVQSAFSQRRKRIGNSMGKRLTKQDFIALDIDSGLRAEELTLAQYIELAHHVHHNSNTTAAESHR